MLLKLLRISSSDSPKIRNGSVIPEFFPVALFIENRYPDTIFVRGYVFRLNVHRYLAQIHICTYSRCGCYSGLAEYILYDRHCKFVRCLMIYSKIIRDIHKHLIYGIHMHVLRRNILQIYVVDHRTVFHVVRHPWRCCYI